MRGRQRRKGESMNIAVILAGGMGVRLGGNLPKQYIEVKGRPVISYCLAVFEEHSEVDAIWIVADEGWRDFLSKWTGVKLKGFSMPGKNRQLSIYNALVDISRYADEKNLVIVHDGVRPLVSERQISDGIKACESHEGAVPVLPMKDTVYMGGGGKITSLLAREKIYAGQAPEVFRLGAYYKANRNLLPDKILAINGSAEPAVLAGMDIAMIPGDENNFKITTKADMERFRRIVEENRL